MGIETIALGALAGSSVLGAIGSIQQGNQQAQLASAQAQQMENQAAGERDAALASAERIRRAGRRAQGEAEAAYAASGVSVGTGTPVRVNEQIGLDAETDAYMAILEGDRRGRTLDYEARATRQAGRNARKSGYVSGAGSVLSAAASYGMWKAGQIGKSPFGVSSGFSGGGTALGSFDGLTGSIA
ncbi:hypothetical protein [Achromobacter xylosoxidans]|uniref:hypothetical protein n=1 Tax=Alcaligenes xylosoxydans xylosoxydans TaxID=85698 RepID=UPI000B48C169|nr:hypothetical protein [Achromobacter xylosoxidans]